MGAESAWGTGPFLVYVRPYVQARGIDVFFGRGRRSSFPGRAAGLSNLRSAPWCVCVFLFFLFFFNGRYWVAFWCGQGRKFACKTQVFQKRTRGVQQLACWIPKPEVRDAQVLGPGSLSKVGPFRRPLKGSRLAQIRARIQAVHWAYLGMSWGFPFLV